MTPGAARVLNSNNLFWYISRSITSNNAKIENAVSLASKCKLRIHLSINKVCFICFFHVAMFVSIKSKADFATSANSKISGFARPHGFKLFADLKISTLESGFKCKFTGYVWTKGESGKKKLRIQKYPDTCGRGLSIRVNE